jgi:peroxiredoxin
MPLSVGERATDFALPDQNGRIVRLGDFRGKKNVVLAFYVLANTPT